MNIFKPEATLTPEKLHETLLSDKVSTRILNKNIILN